MHTRSTCFIFLINLLALCQQTFGQYKGGIADAHANVRLNNVVCVVINTNPFIGGAGDGVANSRKVNITCTVVNANPFIGGSGDGFSDIRITNVSCTPVNTNPFLGGIGGGQSNLRLNNVACTTINTNPFVGGSGDGNSFASVINVNCTLINVNPFLGGIGDGHSNTRITNVACVPVNVNPFLGGPADGHAMAYVQNVTCIPINVNPFKGGFADGHANLRMVNISCSVVNVNPFLGGRASGHSFKAQTNISCGASSLPITLIFFMVKQEDEKIMLSWETASEINNDCFTVERSKENGFFEKILDVDGAGNSSQQLFYETADEDPVDGVSYYRLRQTDYDGRYSFSRTVEVNIDRKSATGISPNPLTNDQEVLLSYESSHDEQISIRIRDALGITVCTLSRQTTKGVNNFQVKPPFLHNGIYFVDVCSSAKTETLKLLVER